VSATAERVPFVDLQAQHRPLATEMRAAIDDVLDAGDFILGQHVAAFEQEFAAYCDARDAIGVDSGTSALELILRGYGIGPGDEVITVANSFVATALAITHAGATPVFVDADARTSTIDVDAIEPAITTRTRAIIPVHLYGQPAGMERIVAIARRYGLVVVEDACQAHGARCDGGRAGSLGDAAAFSFYPSKNLGAAGDGGIVVTSDVALANSVRLLRNYGQVEKNLVGEVGFNRRLDTLQAALLRVKLPYLDEWNRARREAARAYAEHLAGAEAVVLPNPVAGTEPVWHLYVVRVEDRERVQARLGELGVDTGIHYPVPIPFQGPYRDAHLRGEFPVAERDAQRVLSLPMYPHLLATDVERVCDALRLAISGS
jgi:dTDP-4-amino-4,6-dideoxygalactose transaminase